ncbi:MAG: hypothetical protein AAFV47_08275 [Pseudomonadota bacterium]
MKKIALSLALGIAVSGISKADQLTAGNIVVSNGDVVSEYTRDGTFVQSFSVDHWDRFEGSPQSVRDVAVGDDGTLYVYNGTSRVFVSSFNPSWPIAEWRYWSFPTDYPVPADPNFGSLAVTQFGDVYATDQLTEFDIGFERSGVVAYPGFQEGEILELNSNPLSVDTSRFGTEVYYLTTPDESANQQVIEIRRFGSQMPMVFDTEEILGPNEHRSLAIRSLGFSTEVFLADFDGEVHGFAPRQVGSGFDTLTVTPSCEDNTGTLTTCRFIDIESTDTYEFILGTADGQVVILDGLLNQIGGFTVGEGATFVSYVPQTVIPAVIELDITVSTSQRNNGINPSRTRSAWVGVLSSESFDATTIDIDSAAFGPQEASFDRTRRPRDLNGDGIRDLALRFNIRDMGVTCADTQLTFTANTIDGSATTATVPVEITGCN